MRSSRFPCVTPVTEMFSLDRVAIRILLNINNIVPLQKQPTAWTCWLFPQKGSTSNWTASADLTGGAVSVGCEWISTHGIPSHRLVQKEAVDVESNYKKSYFWCWIKLSEILLLVTWDGNPACGDLNGHNAIGKGQGCVSARLVWRKRREGAVWLSAHGPSLDHWVNGDYVVLLTYGKCGLSSLGSWFYSIEWVWNLWAKSMLKWNVSRMTVQEFNIGYIFSPVIKENTTNVVAACQKNILSLWHVILNYMSYHDIVLAWNWILVRN